MEAAGVLDIELVKTLFNYGTPAALLFFAGLAIYLTGRRVGAFLSPLLTSLAAKHMGTMDALETVGRGLLDQQKAQTELMSRQDGKLDEIHKAVVK